VNRRPPLPTNPEGQWRIVPQTFGKFSGPEIAGELVQGVSSDWQILLPDGTANRGVFISVGGRQPGAVIHETYLVA
jgi:hypothetical protein